jgi:dynamin 1-like protein
MQGASWLLFHACCRISDYKNQLKSLGTDVTGNRGKMLHLILTLCQKVEKAFCKIVDGGEGGE